MSPKARSTRAKGKINQKFSLESSTSTPRERVNRKERKRVAPSLSEDGLAVSEPEDTVNGASDAYQDSDEDDVKSLHSDALDDDSDRGTNVRVRKRKRTSPVKPRASKDSSSHKRSRKTAASDDEGGEDPGLKEGQEVVGRIVQAPTTGQVPPGQISQNTFNFLWQLRKPECNDQPVFRLAESEFKLFIEKLTDLFTEVDPQIPPLPPKDVIYRIYRDIRFSNDKTPYKTNFSATFSRSGRKGIFAGFKPGGESLLAAGTWCPGKNELATIRSHIQRNPSRLRRTINAPRFVENFGPAKPLSKGRRQNIFGRDDELKTAPKGIDKDHKDIDLLKCRSFVVVHHFTDDEVLGPDFGQTVIEVVRAARPLVYCMNDYMSVGGDEDEDADPDEEDGDEEGDEQVSD
ncbi:hypothetical protein BJV78DRAFT_1199596 [Lactifluus subvellereus]|nr:hypothetical protein BJV78DRAFT_1199596 [Lactifluus subvellereus]